MATSPRTPSTPAASADGAVTPAMDAYMRARTRNNFHEAVMTAFLAAQAERGLTKLDVARRLGVDPAQVTRWMSGPGNWTIDTVTRLLLAMDAELDPKVVRLADRRRPNDRHPLVAAGPASSAGGAKRGRRPRRGGRSAGG